MSYKLKILFICSISANLALADIVYQSNANDVILTEADEYGAYPFYDITGDGIIDFYGQFNAWGPYVNFFNAGFDSENKAQFVNVSEEEDFFGLTSDIAVLEPGDYVSADSHYPSDPNASFILSNSKEDTNLPPDSDVYVGLYFYDQTGAVHYAWMNVRLRSYNGEKVQGYEFIVNELAYESTPDKGITVGDKGDVTSEIFSKINNSIAYNVSTIVPHNNLIDFKTQKSSIKIFNLNGEEINGITNASVLNVESLMPNSYYIMVDQKVFKLIIK